MQSDWEASGQSSCWPCGAVERTGDAIGSYCVRFRGEEGPHNCCVPFLSPAGTSSWITEALLWWPADSCNAQFAESHTSLTPTLTAAASRPSHLEPVCPPWRLPRLLPSWSPGQALPIASKPRSGPSRPAGGEQGGGLSPRYPLSCRCALCQIVMGLCDWRSPMRHAPTPPPCRRLAARRLVARAW